MGKRVRNCGSHGVESPVDHSRLRQSTVSLPRGSHDSGRVRALSSQRDSACSHLSSKGSFTLPRFLLAQPEPLLLPPPSCLAHGGVTPIVEDGARDPAQYTSPVEVERIRAGYLTDDGLEACHLSPQRATSVTVVVEDSVGGKSDKEAEARRG